MAKADAKKGLVGQTSEFIDGCKVELKKVSRPTRQEAMQATMVTIVMVAVVSGTLALFDVIFGQLMKVLLA